jgi:GNAT superfamily N-acetyltransferase
MKRSFQHGVIPSTIKLRVTHDRNLKTRSEPDDWIRDINVDILEADQKIGTGTLHVIQAENALECDVTLHDLVDAHSDTTTQCGSVVYDLSRGNQDFRPVIYRLFEIDPILDILLLAALEIEPAFRGRGIGLIVLSKMIQRWGKDCSLTVMKPYPLQFSQKEAEETKEFKRALGKLVKYYSRLGFKKIPNGSWTRGPAHYGLSMRAFQKWGPTPSDCGKLSDLKSSERKLPDEKTQIYPQA